MGAADVVPGVSGGTIAFIVGIYDRLINALSGVNKASIMMLFKGDFKGLWHHFDGYFLLALLLGVATSIFGIASAITALLAAYPIWLWSFFFGLILASAYVLLHQVPSFSKRHVAIMMLGVIVGASLSLLVPTQVPATSLMIFFSGMIAICAMILPGISGSFILLMLGMYGFVMTAIKELDILVISIFALGALLGLLSFSKVLNWLLKKAKSMTLTLLTGIMLGALVKVWPWKQVSAYIDVGSKHLPSEEQLLLPWQMTGFNVVDTLLIPVFLMLLGVLMVYGVHYISLQKTNTHTKPS